jgi:hypothetical protein
MEASSEEAKRLNAAVYLPLPNTEIALMALHKKVLEWQAAHPNITWIGWGIVWAIVLAIMLWPRRSG